MRAIVTAARPRGNLKPLSSGLDFGQKAGCSGCEKRGAEPIEAAAASAAGEGKKEPPPQDSRAVHRHRGGI